MFYFFSRIIFYKSTNTKILFLKKNKIDIYLKILKKFFNFMIEELTLDNLVDLYSSLNKEEFIEALSRYFNVEPKLLLLLRKYYFNEYKQGIINIYTYKLVSEPCLVFIYQTFIMKA